MADTNWIVAMFFEHTGPLKYRNQIVQQFLRRHAQQLLAPAVARLEIENVFRAEAGEANPPELDAFKNDARFYREPMNWNLVARDATAIFQRYAHKLPLGTFDMTLLAAAKLDGAGTVLSFDGRFKVIAAAEGLEVFPPLSEAEAAELNKLRG